MTSSDVWDQETAAQYDEGSPEMFSPEVVGPTVNFLAELAGAGRALEFAVGTGRVALPLAARGVAVSGIELSSPMVDQLLSVNAHRLPDAITRLAPTCGVVTHLWCRT
jgi:predicted O-methyltransferase YrrM